MLETKKIPLKIEHRGKWYEGEIIPMLQTGNQSIRYRVMVNDTFLGHIWSGPTHWESEDIPDPLLVQAIGAYIQARFG